MKTESKIVVSLVTAIILLATAGVVQAQSDLGNWQKITANRPDIDVLSLLDPP